MRPTKQVSPTPRAGKARQCSDSPAGGGLLPGNGLGLEHPFDFVRRGKSRRLPAAGAGVFRDYGASECYQEFGSDGRADAWKLVSRKLILFRKIDLNQLLGLGYTCPVIN